MINHEKKCVQKWSREPLLRNKRTTGRTLSSTSWNGSQRNQTISQMSSRVMDNDFPKWLGNKASIDALEDSHLFRNKESTNKQVEIEGKVNRFFFHIKGLNGYLRLRRLIRNIIEKFLNKIEAKSWEGMFRFVKIRFMDSGLFPKVNSALKRVYLKFVKEVNEKMATFFRSVASNELQLLEDIKVCCNLGCINYIFNTRLVN